MIRNLVFDVGSVIVTEYGATALTNLTKSEQEELNHLVFSKDSKFREVILGNMMTAEYRERLIHQMPRYERELNIILNSQDQSITMPKKPEMIELLYELHRVGYKIFFLSDMIDATYEYLKNFLEDFNGGAYSFLEHMRKPDEKFFQLLLDRYSIDPSVTIFFDDKLANVEAARRLGMEAVVFNDISDVVNTLSENLL